MGSVIKRVPILLYHIIGDPPPGVCNPESYLAQSRFESQMRYLYFMGYRTISPKTLIDYYRGIDCDMPKKPLLITFDDGSMSIAEKAAPIMGNFGYQGVVFLVAGLIGETLTWNKDSKEFSDKLLDLEAINSLRDAGFYFGSHTITHARLTGLDKKVRRYEILESKKMLESLLSQDFFCFAYPWGKFDKQTEGMVKEAGYICAFTTHQSERGIFSLRRQNISRSTSLLRFIRKFYTYKFKSLFKIC